MSFQQGLSGLNTTSKNLEVIGNNIANANTFGAKSSRAEFSDMYANAVSGTSNSIGIGVALASVSQQFTQGNITATDNPLDIAINGQGFFQLANSPNDESVIRYSRNGQFKTDKDGHIVNNQGQALMGYDLDKNGNRVSSEAGALKIPVTGIQAAKTESMSMTFNLDSRLPTIPTTVDIDFNDPSTYNRSTSMTVYDANGHSIPVTYYFKKIAEKQWEVYASANNTSLQGGATPTPVAEIEFPADGSPPIPSGTGSTVGVTFAPATTAETDGKGVFSDIPSAFDPELDLTGITMDFSKITQYASAFGVTESTQDGNRPGELSGLSFSNDGKLVVRYSNGVTRAAAEIDLVNFRNPQGLQPTGGNGWAQTASSGDPNPGRPGEGGLGVLQSGALEESNVDLTAELVNMITAQRAYQANAQTIKTMDQVLQTLVNLR
ncbi:MAG: flagellar hook protein FlgE [Pseudomonadota bacterium]